MSDEVLVKVENVSKKFCRSLKRSLLYGLQDIAADLNPFAGKAEKLKTERLKSEGFSSISACQHVSVSAFKDAASDEDLRPGEFYAVRDVSFELKRGECLGMIGRNGAGKTTLLKMLNGLIKPDHGRIEMRGRVGALIALGAGFNPILTGRENIDVNGSVLGLSKREIDAKIKDIIDFADIREFIDSPVQSYSSGMQVRLGFAIATAMEPDVLLLDEVLAVGDAAFRNKCYQRIDSLRKRAAVIFVSHSMEQVARVCDHALTMSKGRVEYCGSVTEGVAIYERMNDEPAAGIENKAFLSLQPPILAFTVTDLPTQITSGTPLRIMFHVASSTEIRQFLLRLAFYNASGAAAADCNVSSANCSITIQSGGNSWIVEFASLPLKNGKYRISFNIIDQAGDLLVWSYKHHEIEVIGAYGGAFADCQLPLGKWETSRNSSASTNECNIRSKV